MKGSSLSVTPSFLICAAFLVLFLLAPGSIPCVYARCGNPATGTVEDLEVVECVTCSADDAQDETINVTNCPVCRSASTCEITATVDVRIKGQCDVLWSKRSFIDPNWGGNRP